jgi:hypothetical protein
MKTKKKLPPKIDTQIPELKCKSCGKLGGTKKKHQCPYQNDVHENNSNHCNCCENCQQNCSDEI